MLKQKLNGKANGVHLNGKSLNGHGANGYGANGYGPSAAGKILAAKPGISARSRPKQDRESRAPA